MNSSTRINDNIVSSEPKHILVNIALGWNIIFSIVSNPLNHVFLFEYREMSTTVFAITRLSIRNVRTADYILKFNEMKGNGAQEMKKQNKKHIDVELRLLENNLNSQIFNAHQNNFSIWILSIFKHKSGKHSRQLGI